jgi:hypothetical protein
MPGDHAHARIAAVRREDEYGREVVALHGRQVLFSLLRRQIGDNRSPYPNLRHGTGKGIDAVFEENIVVGHEEKRDVEGFGHPGGKIDAVPDGYSSREGVLVGLEYHRTVGHWLGKGDLQLHQIDACLDHFPYNLEGGFQRRIADHDVGHQQDFFIF